MGLFEHPHIERMLNRSFILHSSILFEFKTMQRTYGQAYAATIVPKINALRTGLKTRQISTTVRNHHPHTLMAADDSQQ